MRLGLLIFLVCPFFLSAQEVFRDIESTHGRELEVQYLDLKGKKYSHFPNEIRAFKNLKHLSLRRAGLESLPEWLSELPIEELVLTKNRIKEFPKVILELKDLRSLYFGHNYLLNIPKEIASLEKLEKIDLWANAIEDLPAEMATMSNLKMLDLRSMDLNRHQQAEFREMFPNVDLKMSPPCNCN